MQLSFDGAGFSGIHRTAAVGAFKYGNFGYLADFHGVFNYCNTVINKVNKKPAEAGLMWLQIQLIRYQPGL